jgi:hypothetical protein
LALHQEGLGGVLAISVTYAQDELAAGHRVLACLGLQEFIYRMGCRPHG